jgi:WXXGXW repeat (2 copies)
MKRLIASAAIAVPLVLAAFTTQANAGITIRLGEPGGIYRQNDRDYRQDEYNLGHGNVYTVPRRNIRVIERNQGRRIWMPEHWNNVHNRRVWVPGHYIYR